MLGFHPSPRCLSRHSRSPTNPEASNKFGGFWNPSLVVVLGIEPSVSRIAHALQLSYTLVPLILELDLSCCFLPFSCVFFCSHCKPQKVMWKFPIEHNAKSPAESYVGKPVSAVVLGASVFGNLFHSFWPRKLGVKLYLESESVGFMAE